MVSEKIEITNGQLLKLYLENFITEIWSWAEKDINGVPNYKLYKSCVGYVEHDMLTKKYYAYPYRTYFKSEYRYNSGIGPFDSFKDGQFYVEKFNNNLQLFLRRVFNIETV